MRTKILLVPFILLFLMPCIAFSDIITQTDGSRIEGRILNATETHVVIETDDSKTLQIPQSEIKSIFFSWADSVHLISGDKIKCKIIKRISPDLHIITTEGLQKIPLVDVKMFFYHSAQGLQIPTLPTTGRDFQNQKAFTPKGLKNSFNFGMSYGIQRPPMNKWKEEFMAAAWDFTGSAKLGFFLTNSISLGVGMTFANYSQVHHEDINSRYNSYHIYGSLEYFLEVEKSPASYIFLGVDAGLFNVRGKLHLYSFREIEFNENSFAFMPKVGARTFLEKRVSFSLEAAYLFAKSGSIQIPVEYIDDFVIDFNGFLISFNMLYHL